jgi:hypothetical protein
VEAPEVPPETASPSIEAWSEKAMRRELLWDAVQHPSSIVPAFVAGLSLLSWLLFSGLPVVSLQSTPQIAVPSIIVFTASTIVAAASFAWLYRGRYEREYARRLQRWMED